MSLAVLADHLASKGRGDDKMLVHMTPGEVRGLQALALAHGGSLSINPETGLVEAGWLKRLLPAIAGFALNAIAPGVGSYIGGLLGASGAVGTGIAIGGLTGLATGSLKQGIMAGLGAYGGAGLAQGLVGASSAGASTAAAEAAKAASEQLVRDNAMAASVGADLVTGSAADKFVQDAASKAYSDFAAQPLMAQAKGSFGALKDAGGLSSLLRPAMAAAAPVVADAMVPTTTQMPSGRGYQYTPRIRPMAWNQYTGELEQLPMFSAINTGGKTAGVPGLTPAQQQQQQQQEQQPGGYNTGGIVALANGGDLTKAQLGAQAIPYAQGTAATAKDIADIYQSVLGRAPDEGGLQFYQASQFSPEQIRADILKSPEAQAFTAQQNTQSVSQQAPLTHAQLGAQAIPYAKGVAATESDINQIYRDMLGRTPDEGGFQFYKASQFSPEQIRAEIAKSQEYLTRPFTPEPQTMQEVRSGYEAGGGGTQMRSVNTPEPGAQVMTQNRVVDALQAYLAANPNATIGQIQAWGVANRIPAAQLAAAINERRFSQMTGASLQAYDYLMGRGAYPVNQTLSGGRPIMRPYLEAVSPTQSGGFFGRQTIPTDPNRSTAQSADNTGSTTGGTATTGGGNTTFIGGAGTNMANANVGNMSTGVDTTRSTDAATVGGVVVGNNVIDPISGRVLGVVTANVDQGTGGIIQGDVVVDPITGKIIGYSQDAGIVGRLVNKSVGEEPAPIESRYVPSNTSYYDFGAGDVSYDSGNSYGGYDSSSYDFGQGDIGGYGGSYTREEMDALAGLRSGGLADVAAAGAAHGGQFNLGGYSDGGRLLRGPGDGVSDSIPATIGGKQPARLADGEFVIPARIVSEIGNGSTEAGARKLYKMMDRVQRARAKTTGKGRVAKDTGAEKYLPA